MNKRGISDAYLVIIQVVLIGIVFVTMVARVDSLVDVDAIRRTGVASNFAFIYSTITFLPANFYYAYLTEDDSLVLRWKTFVGQIEKNQIIYGEDATKISVATESTKPLILNQKFNLTTNIFSFAKNGIYLQKTEEVKVYQKIEKELRKLECEYKKNEYHIRLLNGGEKNKHYDASGNQITGDVTTRLNGFEEQHYINNVRVYKAELGVGKEVENLLKIMKIINSSYVNNYINHKNLNQKHILLTTGNYSDKYNFIIAYVPIKTYQEDYKIACTILNKIIEPNNHNQILRTAIKGITIIPHHEENIILEIANDNFPQFYIQQNLEQIAEVLKDG